MINLEQVPCRILHTASAQPSAVSRQVGRDLCPSCRAYPSLILFSLKRELFLLGLKDLANRSFEVIQSVFGVWIAKSHTYNTYNGMTVGGE